jgi:hypothetical protein
MMSKPHFLKSRDLVLRLADDDLDDGLSIHACLSAQRVQLAGALLRASASAVARAPPSLRAGMSNRTAASFACQRGLIRWSIRAQVILSMQTSIDLPDSQRVAQCSTKSSASLSSRSSAVMTS